MIPEVMNSVLLFAIVVLSDIEIEFCTYLSMDGSCSGALLNGQCTSLCDSYDCSGNGITCSLYESAIRQGYGVDFGDCFNNGYDLRVTCGGGDSDNNGDNGSGGNDNGGSDNGGSDNGGSDNGGSDNGGSDNDDDDEIVISIGTCTSRNGLCEQCHEAEYDISIFQGTITTCEQLKTHLSGPYGGFEDYGSCFTQGYDTFFTCSGPAASSSSDNTGMIVGIVIGCIVLVAGIATFVFCMKKQNKL